MKKFLLNLFTLVRNLWPRHKTASDAFLSESLRCCKCGREITDGEGLFFDRWYCLECLDGEKRRQASDHKSGL